MIHVTLKDEPEDFDIKVRQPGLEYLIKQGIDTTKPPPDPQKLPALWQGEPLKQLWAAYDGICAYLSIYIRLPSGNATVDHFIPKSKVSGQAYEWNNFRLSCLSANRNKREYEDVLDPFELWPETFFINFSDGKIYPNPMLPPEYQEQARNTITRLKLDVPECRTMRAEDYRNYENGTCTLRYLKRYSPFVHCEIVRQGLN